MPVVVGRRRRAELDLDVGMPLHEFRGDRLVELGERRERVEHVERDLLRARPLDDGDRACERGQASAKASSFLIVLSLVGDVTVTLT